MDREEFMGTVGFLCILFAVCFCVHSCVYQEIELAKIKANMTEVDKK